MISRNNLITIYKLWPDFLTFIDGTIKGLSIQCENDTQLTNYTIFALDQLILYECQIYKTGFEPTGWTAQQIADNTTYRTDFETNWLSLINAQIVLKTTDPGGPLGPGVQKGPITGRVATSAVTQVPIRSTAYTEPAAAAQRSLVSANAADAAAGTGARVVRIVYYDNAMKGPFVEDVTLNGVTSVNTVATNIRFIETVVVLTSGNNGSNVGIISLKDAGGGGTTYATIPAGANATQWAHHYVPVGRTMNLRCVSGSVLGALGGLVTAKYKNPLLPLPVERQVGIPVRIASNAGETVREMHIPQSLLGPGRIILYITPDGTTAVTFFGAFEYNESIS